MSLCSYLLIQTSVMCFKGMRNIVQKNIIFFIFCRYKWHLVELNKANSSLKGCEKQGRSTGNVLFKLLHVGQDLYACIFCIEAWSNFYINEGPRRCEIPLLVFYHEPQRTICSQLPFRAQVRPELYSASGSVR